MCRRGVTIETILALAIAMLSVIVCQAQDSKYPPRPPADVVAAPGLSPTDCQASPPLDIPGSLTRLPPTASPDLIPDTTAPSPEVGGKNTDAGQYGDVMEFGGRGGVMGLGDGRSPFDSFRYGGIWFPNVPVQGQASQFQMVGQDLSFTHPLWTDSVNAVSLSGSVCHRLTDTAAILPDTGQPFPENLWNVSLGLRYARQLGDGWMTGGGLSIGSASDRPFATIHEMNVGMNAMLRMPQGEHNAWIFSLMYSPTSELPFPVPGVAFNYNPSPQFHANIGLPFLVTWRPTDDWQFQASYMLIHTIHLKAIHRLADRLSVFAAYDWSNETYMLLDRPEENDRFFLYDQRVSMGLQALLAPHWTASVSAGYVFDRFMFEGTSFASQGFDRVNLGNGPFASLNLGVRF